MIFAELDYACSYEEAHDGLPALMSRHFIRVESGFQGDSYVWVHDGGARVAIDTFTSMKHPVKSASPGVHVQRVMDVLGRHYVLHLREPPEPEGHE